MTKPRYHVRGQTSFSVWSTKPTERIAVSLDKRTAEILAAALNEVEDLKRVLVNAAIPLEVLDMGIRQGDERHSAELRDDITHAVGLIREAVSHDAHASEWSPAPTEHDTKGLRHTNTLITEFTFDDEFEVYLYERILSGGFNRG